MSGRRLILSTGIASALFLITGCQGRPNAAAPSSHPIAQTSPKTNPGSPLTADQPAANHVAAPAPVSPAEPALRISPESFTITPDDAGLQLLAVRTADGSSRDLTSQVQWTAEPAGVVELEPGGYLRPVGQGVVTVKAALGSQSATSRITLAAVSARSWDFAEDIVPGAIVR